MGWVASIPPDTLIHNESNNIGNRRPVLLYGDSFAACVTADVLCFDDILNNDPEFSEQHYHLNYGVPGYGLDQIHLLFDQTVDLYEDPFVIFSFMTLDPDRNILTFRGKPKPYFHIENDTLQLQGTPLNLEENDFIAANPPQIKSYLYRKLIFSSFFPEQLHSFLRAETRKNKQKKEIGEKIILETLKILEERDIDFVFLVFHPHYPGVSTLDNENDWRDLFLDRLLTDQNVPYVWSKEIYRQDSAVTGQSFDYYISNDGHPTTYFNNLISQQILSYILGS